MNIKLQNQGLLPHIDNWVAYNSYNDSGVRTLIVCDLGWYELKPIKSYENYISISIQVEDINENFMPTKKEFELFYQIEDELVDNLTEKSDAIFVGAATDSFRDWFFYVKKNKINYVNQIQELLLKYSDRKIEVKEINDKNWDLYSDFLYPDEEYLNEIENSRVIEEAMKNGDDITQPRPVDFWIYFKTEKERLTAEKEVLRLGFTIGTKEKIKKSESKNYPFLLQFNKTINLEEDSIDEITWLLKLLADKFKGEYDGWETIIVK